MNPRIFRVPVIVGTLALAMSGCAVPVAVSIASYGFSGLSMAATEKGMGDLALSQAMDKDCATWRIIKGEDICRDYTPKERHDMALAQLEADNYGPGYSHASEPTGALVPIRSHAELVAELDRKEAAERALASASPKPQGKPQEGKETALAQASAQAAPVAATTQPAVERVTGVPLAPLKPAAMRQASLPLPPEAKPRAPVKLAAARAVQPAAHAPKLIAVVPPLPPSSRNPKDGSGDNAFLVLGSYSTRAHAEAGLAHYAAVRPLLSVATIDGKEVYRVVSGPFGAEDLAKARASLAKSYDVRDSWAIPRCGDADAVGCAVAKPADPQLAALPVRN